MHDPTEIGCGPNVAAMKIGHPRALEDEGQSINIILMAPVKSWECRLFDEADNCGTYGLIDEDGGNVDL